MTECSGLAFFGAVASRKSRRGAVGRRRCGNCVRLAHDLADAEGHLLRLEEQVKRLRGEFGGESERVKELERELEEWRRGWRARGKRYPDRQAGKSGPPKRPGRAAGHPGSGRPRPTECDRMEPVPPGPCEKCGGHCAPTGAEVVYPVEEIRFEREVVGFGLQEGCCEDCGHRQYAKLPAELGPRPKVGVNAQALALMLRNDVGLSFGKIVRVFQVGAGFQITKGALVQLMRRTRERLLPARAEIQQRLRNSPFAHLDETGARHMGKPSYLWLACTPDLSFFEHGPGRDAEVIVRILGAEYPGILVVDFYSAYVRYVTKLATAGARLQTCWPHLLREARRVAEIEGTPEAAEFHDRLQRFYLRAKDMAAREQPWLQAPGEFLGLYRRFDNLAWHPELRASDGVARLQDRMTRFGETLLRFVEEPGLPGSNNAAERDQRPFVIFRSTSFCTRSDEGMKDLSHLLSVTQTLRKQGRTWFTYLPEALSAHWPGRPLPSVFAPSATATPRGLAAAHADVQTERRRRPTNCLPSAVHHSILPS